MKDSTHANFIKLVGGRAGPFSVAADDSLLKDGSGRGLFDLSAMAEAIEFGGYVIEYEDGKTGARCQVFKPFTAEERAGCSPEATDADCRHLAAHGFAPNRESAFMHAVFGAVREEDAAAAVAKALDEKGVKVDADLRAKLEQRYILEGGAARLKEDMKAFEKPVGVQQ